MHTLVTCDTHCLIQPQPRAVVNQVLSVVCDCEKQNAGTGNRTYIGGMEVKFIAT